MPEDNDSDLKRLLKDQASEAVFLFNSVYAGLDATVHGRDHRVKIAIALTSAIIRNIAVIGAQEDA